MGILRARVYQHSHLNACLDFFYQSVPDSGVIDEPESDIDFDIFLLNKLEHWGAAVFEGSVTQTLGSRSRNDDTKDDEGQYCR